MRTLKRETQSLSCPLTREEFDARAKELAELLEEHRGECETQAHIKKEMKLKLEELEQKRDELARVVRDRAEDRIVEVQLLADDVKGTVNKVRMDTGEVVHERPMNESERQLSMDVN